MGRGLSGFTRVKTNFMKHENITAIILKSFYKVYNTLGYEFLEKVYQNSLFLELVQQNLSVQKQRPMSGCAGISTRMTGIKRIY